MTKEDLNNNPSKYSFSRNERLKSRKAIASLFKKRSYFIFNDIKVLYKKETATDITQIHKVGFTVPKANFKRAVDRNLLKRRMRESYRRNKYRILNIPSNRNELISMMFVYIGKEIITWDDINTSIQKLLHKIK